MCTSIFGRCLRHLKAIQHLRRVLLRLRLRDNFCSLPILLQRCHKCFCGSRQVCAEKFFSRLLHVCLARLALATLTTEQSLGMYVRTEIPRPHNFISHNYCISLYLHRKVGSEIFPRNAQWRPPPRTETRKLDLRDSRQRERKENQRIKHKKTQIHSVFHVGLCVCFLLSQKKFLFPVGSARKYNMPPPRCDTFFPFSFPPPSFFSFSLA